MTPWITATIDLDKLNKLKEDSKELNDLKNSLKNWKSSLVHLNINTNKIIYEWVY